MRNFVLEDEIYEESSNNNEHNNVAAYFRSEKNAREIVNIRKLLKKKIEKNEIFCSFELFPMKNSNNTYKRFFSEMDKYSPLFYALTWHTKNTSKDYPSLELVKMFPSNTLLHLAAKSLTRAEAEFILKEALDHGINNIFVLQGESTIVSGDFPYAVDLINFIKSRFENKFCICAAGYPEMHPRSASKESDLFYLKMKVDAGADFIITQIVFEANVFIDFVKDCRKIGITVPIIPGIFPISNYKSLEKMANICNVKIPTKILNTMQSIKNNEEAVNNYGIELITNVIKGILESGTAHGFHLFTLNRTSSASKICKRIGIS